jgi:hypothetical protein
VKPIHVTGRGLFQQCRRAFQYGECWNLSPKKPNLTLAFGTALHAGMAAFYTRKDAVQTAMRRWDELTALHDWASVDDKVAAATEFITIFERYVGWCREHDDFEVVAAEQEIKAKLKLPSGRYATLVGTVDLLVRRQGKLWVLDHKTVQAFKDPEELQLNDQMTAYIWLVERAYKERVGGAIYSQARKSVPRVPPLIQNGTRLELRAIDTTREVYLAEILRYGFNPADYEDMLSKLARNEFFRREYIAQTHIRLKQFEHDLRVQLDDIQRAVEEGTMYPSPSWLCLRYCDYLPLCRVAMENGDVRGMAELTYRNDEKKR